METIIVKFKLGMRTIIIYNLVMNFTLNATDQRLPLPVAADRQPDVRSGAHTASPARVFSQSLFSGAEEVEIEHHGAVYRLRQTSLGKLILTK